MKELVQKALEGAAFAHHNEFIEVHGEDELWAFWYAKWLMHESELASVFEEKYSMLELGKLLQSYDGQYQTGTQEGTWSEAYAKKIARELYNMHL